MLSIVSFGVGILSLIGSLILRLGRLSSYAPLLALDGSAVSFHYQ
ncbi:hypothetical protein ONA22_00425 [Mycoplasmopsis cynos]|nr:hypothetical protein [Mycoplasmopsis cynos]WAM03540.1 hypothetical protein ONA22_00425 [Mycoplasmopsis cynos]